MSDPIDVDEFKFAQPSDTVSALALQLQNDTGPPRPKLRRTSGQRGIRPETVPSPTTAVVTSPLGPVLSPHPLLPAASPIAAAEELKRKAVVRRTHSVQKFQIKIDNGQPFTRYAFAWSPNKDHWVWLPSVLHDVAENDLLLMSNVLMQQLASPETSLEFVKLAYDSDQKVYTFQLTSDTAPAITVYMMYVR